MNKDKAVNLGNLMSPLGIKNYIKQIGTDEGQVKQFNAVCANSQDLKDLLMC